MVPYRGVVVGWCGGMVMVVVVVILGGEGDGVHDS